MDGNDPESIVADLIEDARAAVNDCRMSYVTLQVDKDDVDEWVRMFGADPINWHPEPCKHLDEGGDELCPFCKSGRLIPIGPNEARCTNQANHGRTTLDGERDG